MRNVLQNTQLVLPKSKIINNQNNLESSNPYFFTCLKMVMLSLPSLLSDMSNAWQAFSMSRKHVTGSLLIANTMSPCSNRFSASDPAKHPFTRKTCRLIGSFLTRAYEMSLPSLNYKSEVKLNCLVNWVYSYHTTTLKYILLVIKYSYEMKYQDLFGLLSITKASLTKIYYRKYDRQANN